MKRIQKLVVVNILAALMVTGIPAMAAQERHDNPNVRTTQFQATQNREFRNDQGHDRGRRIYNTRNDEHVQPVIRVVASDAQCGR